MISHLSTRPLGKEYGVFDFMGELSSLFGTDAGLRLVSQSCQNLIQGVHIGQEWGQSREILNLI
jgi:hypothetical protein